MQFVYDDGGRSVYGKPRQRKSLVGDCCVRSVAIVSDTRYDLVWEKARHFTGTPGRGMSRTSWRLLASAFTSIEFRIPDKSYLLGKTLRDCYEDLRSGRHLALVHDRGRCSHLTAVVDGDTHDSWDCRDFEVRAVLTVTPKSQRVGYPDLKVGQEVVFQRSPGCHALGKVEIVKPKSVSVTQLQRQEGSILPTSSVWNVAKCLVRSTTDVCRLALEQAATQPKRLAGAPQVGQRVSFEHKGDILTGKVARINRKSVTVSAAPGIDWRVAHDLLLEPKE